MELHFTHTNGAADKAIEQLITLVGGIRRKEIVREMILAALKAGQEDDQKADLKLRAPNPTNPYIKWPVIWVVNSWLTVIW